MDNKQGVMLYTKEKTRPDHGVEVHQLPSSTRNVPRRHWTIQPGGDIELDEEREIYEVRPSA